MKRRHAISENFFGSIYAHRQQLGERYGVVGFSGEDSGAKLDYDFDALASDPEFVNILSQIDFLSRFRRDLVESTYRELGDLKNELAEKFEKGGRRGAMILRRVIALDDVPKMP
jgi:hypothetical protein